jgi:hypothetical protein
VKSSILLSSSQVKERLKRVDSEGAEITRTVDTLEFDNCCRSVNQAEKLAGSEVRIKRFTNL